MPAALHSVDALSEHDCTVGMPLFDENGNPTVDDDSVFIVGIANPQRFDRLVAEAKAANAHMSEQELDAIINEAVQWARSADARDS